MRIGEEWMRPSIDHTLLSPSGHVSKRARAAAIKREAARLFPPGFWDEPERTDEEKRADEVVSLKRHAATLRDLAACGMNTRRYNSEADKIDARVNELEGAIFTIPNTTPLGTTRPATQAAAREAPLVRL